MTALKAITVAALSAVAALAAQPTQETPVTAPSAEAQVVPSASSSIESVKHDVAELSARVEALEAQIALLKSMTKYETRLFGNAGWQAVVP